MPPSLIPGIFGKGTSPLNLHFCLISFLFEARELAGLWIDKDENTAVGGPCLAHKPWPENRLRQVGTGSSVFPLIKWRGRADTFLQEPQWGGRWGLLRAPCVLLPCFTLEAASHRLGVELSCFCVKHPVLSLSLPLGCCFWCVLQPSLPSAGTRENVYLWFQCLGTFGGAMSCLCTSEYCTAWLGVAQPFPGEKLSPGLLLKSPSLLCKAIIISSNWAALGLNLQRLLGFGKSSATAKQIMLNKRLPWLD